MGDWDDGLSLTTRGNFDFYQAEAALDASIQPWPQISIVEFARALSLILRMMNETTWVAAQAQHIGARPEQQDACASFSGGKGSRNHFAVVADGLGGEQGGRLAAESAMTIADQLWKQCKGKPADPSGFLKRYCQTAHERMLLEGAADGITPRTTIAALLVVGDRAYWAHSGDSRIYHFREGRLLQRTKDHSVAQALLGGDRPDDEAELAQHPGQGRLLQSLGGKVYKVPSFSESGVCPGDSFILCSDGLWTQCPVEELGELAKVSPDDLNERVRSAVHAAVSRAAEKSDNVSVVALCYPAAGAAVSSRVFPVKLALVALVTFLAILTIVLKSKLSKQDESKAKLPFRTAPIAYYPVAISDSRSIKLTYAEAVHIGKAIWKNECGGTREGLLGWNAGEGFASLGIGHFIWFPKGLQAPYEESFPALVTYLQQSKVKGLPQWLLEEADCPWASKAAFDRAKSGKERRLIELRDFLSRTVPEQTAFILNRLENSLPKMLTQAKKAGVDASVVKDHFYAVARTKAGKFALMDYVNFKGDGTNPKERFKGQGWGLLQVLGSMDRHTGGANAVKAFAKAAAEQLTRRTRNNPADKRWLKGWLNRVNRYPAGPS